MNVSLSSAPARPAPVLPRAGTLTPLGIDESRITGGLWAEKQSVNAAATLAHIGARLESEGWLPNFDLAAAGTLPEGRRGREFADSEVYKYLEALAWEIGRSGSDELERTFRAAVARVAAAQEADGYLNTMFGRPGQAPRWSALEWGHELYCAGHLLQAAVARARTRPGSDDGLLEVAIRVADLIVAEFGPGARERICGHAEIELGLAELGRATGDARYTAQARLFVERHGRHSLADIEFGREYFQDAVPVREAQALHGHSVRANYLASASVDVAVDTGDAELLTALEAQWARTVARRTYITGGQGAHHQDEAFGEDWELPSDRAYSETCAGIGSIMFAWRLLLATGEARYADLIERTLYNVLATSVSDDGRAFFYSNPLQQRVEGTVPDPDETVGRASTSLRAPWFSVSCCPTNIGRTVASLGAYVATTTEGGVQLHQYAPGEICTVLPATDTGSGSRVALTVETAYPADGRIVVRVDEPGDYEIALRVPAWAEGATLDGVPVEPGYARVHDAWDVGDVVVLELPVAPRVTVSDPRIDAVRGSVAIERGPEVWALESIDLGADAGGAALVPGSVRADGEGIVADFVVRDDGADEWPYAAARPAAGERRTAALVPYRRWGNRGPATMRVWLPLAD